MAAIGSPFASLDAPALARFDAALHAIHPDAPPIDAARLSALAQWLLDLPPAQARRELQQRLARLRELRRMAADRDWDTDPELSEHLARLLAFVGDDDGHLPERTAGLGRLDDALMVELAWPAFADEVEDYLDFCRFRHEQHPRGAKPLTRSDWIRLRREQGMLWQRMQQVHRADHAHVLRASPAV
jgi:hypothetical protein